MSIRHASQDRTICEVIRKVNDLAQGSSEKDWAIRNLCTEMEIMAKKITLKLIDYKRKVDEDGFIEWEHKNPTFEEDLKRRLREDYKIGK